MNLLIGGSAAAAFFTLVTTLCIINAYLWKGEKKGDITPGPTVNEIRIVAIGDSGHPNAAYQQEEDMYTKLHTKGQGSTGAAKVQGTGIGVTAM